jgi:hypothetical protein
MISTRAGIDKYTFYLDFKGVLSSTPQVSVSGNIVTKVYKENVICTEINKNFIVDLDSQGHSQIKIIL